MLLFKSAITLHYTSHYITLHYSFWSVCMCVNFFFCLFPLADTRHINRCMYSEMFCLVYYTPLKFQVDFVFLISRVVVCVGDTRFVVGWCLVTSLSSSSVWQSACCSVMMMNDSMLHSYSDDVHKFNWLPLKTHDHWSCDCYKHEYQRNTSDCSQWCYDGSGTWYTVCR